MGRKLMGALRVASVAVVTAGAAFGVIAFTMPGDQVSGTQSIATEIAPTPIPERPSYLANVPKAGGTTARLFVADTPDVATTGAAQLKIGKTASAKPAEAADDAFTISASALNIRAEPSSQSASLFVLAYGTKVQVAEREGGWAQVTDPNGRVGWAYSKYLAKSGDMGNPSEGIADAE
jgi:hypothetical protein